MRRKAQSKSDKDSENPDGGSSGTSDFDTGTSDGVRALLEDVHVPLNTSASQMDSEQDADAEHPLLRRH